MNLVLKTAPMIGRHNDAFRSNFGSCHVDGELIDGKVRITQGIAQVSDLERTQIIQKVVTFSEFSDDIDPFAEHCFGTWEHPTAGKMIWTISYFADENCEHEIEVDENSAEIYRVLTIMQWDEW